MPDQAIIDDGSMQLMDLAHRTWKAFTHELYLVTVRNADVPYSYGVSLYPCTIGAYEFGYGLIVSRSLENDNDVHVYHGMDCKTKTAALKLRTSNGLHKRSSD
eukprot:scaffold276806_cov21-Prasinocladus_malaysianus.AAC.1